MENNNDKLMMRFKRAALKPSGKREISSTSDVDAGLGNRLLQVLEDIEITDTRSWCKPLREFLGREKSDQLKFGDFDDVEAFLRAYRAAAAGRRASIKNPLINSNAMPVLNLCRKPGIQPHDNTLEVDNDDAGFITDENKKPIALLSSNPVEINYSLMVLAHEKEVLNALTSYYASWFRQFTNYGGTNFTAKSILAGAMIEVNCLIRDPKAVMIDDLSVAISENRIFASSLSFTVVAPVLTAWKGTPANVTVDVFAGGGSGVISNGRM